jgi:hypothetical protein
VRFGRIPTLGISYPRLVRERVLDIECRSKVGYFRHATDKQDIVGLDVAVDTMILRQVLKCGHPVLEQRKGFCLPVRPAQAPIFE